MRTQSYMVAFFFFLCVLSFIMQRSPARAAENTYDLNKVRLRYFHLLNLFPADNTLVSAPGGVKATPTPGATATPTPLPATPTPSPTPTPRSGGQSQSIQEEQRGFFGRLFGIIFH